MSIPADHIPLTEQEFGHLDEFLGQVTNPSGLSLEGMDGLFCALIAGPAWVVPRDYLPLLWGSPLRDENVDFNIAQVNATIYLLARHWNSVMTELDGGGAHQPLIDHAVASARPGRAWAQGFMRGVNFVRVGWDKLLQDQVSSELYQMPRLAYDADCPARRQLHRQPMTGSLPPWLAPAVSYAYEYFLDQRLADRVRVELMAESSSPWQKKRTLP